VGGADAIVVALPDAPETRALIAMAQRRCPGATFVDRSRFGDGPLPADVRAFGSHDDPERLCDVVLAAIGTR
jgi:hypothetical protein